jgi:photosystem II stability/assembly factor-like uncharacterized protein
MKKQYNFQLNIRWFILPLILFLCSLNVTAQYQYIIGHPRDLTVDDTYTGLVTFSVDLLPHTAAEYQWYYIPLGETNPVAIKEAINPVLEMTMETALHMKLNDAPVWCLVTGDGWKEESLSAYLYIVKTRTAIAKHPVDVIREEGFTGEVYYGVDLLPGTEFKEIYWYVRQPGSDWKEYGTGQQIPFKILELNDKLLGTAFRCVVTHSGGEDVSNTAYLWVKHRKRYIVLEPVDVTKPEGFVGKIIYNIEARGIGLYYQWQIRYPGKTWTDLKGADKPELVYPVEKPLPLDLDGTAFRCVVWDEKKYMECSEPAYLHVEQARKYILLDPQDITENEGFSGYLKFYIKYDDPVPLGFQWQIREPGGIVWTDILDATKPELSYLVKYLTKEWSGTAFRCAVYDKDGYVEYSNPAFLYVKINYIVGHPRNVTQCEGYDGDIIFRIKPAEGVKLTFQWQLLRPDESKWTDIPGADSIVYIQYFEELPLSYNKYAYRCRAMDEMGIMEFSDVAFLYVNAIPRITSNPVSQTKLLGEAVTFNVSASGYKPLSYQWQKDEENLSGANSSSYSIAPIAADDSGYYRCVVSNACLPSGVASNAAKLTVTVPKYTDGWFSQDIVTSKNLTDIKFTGDFSGWVSVSNSNSIYKTIDGGDEWTATSLGLTQDWNAVFTTDDDHVWTAGGPKIAYSADGGSSWDIFSIATLGLTGDSVLYDLYFTNDTTGWAVGDNGLIIQTVDSGAHWTIQNSGDFSFVPGSDVLLESVHFFNSDTGWVVGEQGKILVTNDGGTNWALQTSGVTVDLKDVFFVDKLNGWITGGNYILLKTTDGGENWSTVTIPFPGEGEYLNGVHFADLLNGWVVSSDGKIFRTNDGGVNWYSQASGTTNSLNAIDFADYDNGWVVGDVSTILRTAYSGCLLPMVSLYEDKAFCASVNYELIADTFKKNVDCSYLWSTEEETGSIVVTESGKYYVTVTSVCGKEVSDTVNIELYPLPEADAGNDDAICDGDSVQLLATGGVLYSWNNESYLDDPLIQNPKAGPPVGTTDFIVTVTDDNECQNTDTVEITVYPIPTSIFTASDYVCGTGMADITYTGSASANGNFYWDFDEGSTVHSGDSIGPYEVSWDASGEKTLSLVVEENGCSSDTTFETLDVYPVPSSDFEVTSRVCGDDTVTVTYQGEATTGADYHWSFDGGTTISGTGQGPYEISWATEGTKTVDLWVTENNCTSNTTTKDVLVAYPYEGEEICLVTIDLETGMNMVVWEKAEDAGIASYNVYRESATSGVYDLLANIPYDNLSVYVDMTSQPEVKSYKYRISVIDTCGNESSPSPYHKTMLLTSNLGPNAINLSWTEYVVEDGGFGFVKYLIYRGDAPNNLAVIDSIASDNTLYPDYNPPDDTMYYRIAGVKEAACYPSVSVGKKAGAGPYSHSLSNLEDNRLETSGIKDLEGSEFHLNVYPNPFSQETRITYTLNEMSEVKIEVFNLLGARVAVVVNKAQAPGDYAYDLTAADIGSTEGVYYMRFTANGKNAIRKLILSR